MSKCSCWKWRRAFNKLKQLQKYSKSQHYVWMNLIPSTVYSLSTICCSLACLSVCLSVCLKLTFRALALRLSRVDVCLSACLSVCLSIHSSVCLSICLSHCLSVSHSEWVWVCQCVSARQNFTKSSYFHIYLSLRFSVSCKLLKAKVLWELYVVLKINKIDLVLNKFYLCTSLPEMFPCCQSSLHPLSKMFHVHLTRSAWWRHVPRLVLGIYLECRCTYHSCSERTPSSKCIEIHLC